MAIIRFSGKAADATAGGGGGQKFHAAPRGIYTLAIADHSEGELTKAGPGAKYPGTPITKLTCEIAEGEYLGCKVWHNVTWIPRGDGEKPNPGHGIAVHFLHALGFEKDLDNFEFQESDLQGQTFRALLEVETYEKKGTDGRTYTNEKNVIREIYSDNHREPAELPAPPAKKPANLGGHPEVSHVIGKTGREVRENKQTADVGF